jgi:hypothetical protein
MMLTSSYTGRGGNERDGNWKRLGEESFYRIYGAIRRLWAHLLDN